MATDLIRASFIVDVIIAGRESASTDPFFAHLSAETDPGTVGAELLAETADFVVELDGELLIPRNRALEAIRRLTHGYMRTMPEPRARDIRRTPKPQDAGGDAIKRYWDSLWHPWRERFAELLSEGFSPDEALKKIMDEADRVGFVNPRTGEPWSRRTFRRQLGLEKRRSR